MNMDKILVTGGAGFIGSAFVRLAVGKSKVVVLDKLTYAGDLKRLESVKGKFGFYKTDVKDINAVEKIFKTERPDAVVNFAAETHVDRSIKSPRVFLETNILGTQNVLEAARKSDVKRFVHISTDEVYGDIKSGTFTEESPLKPNNPYSASKAAADLLIRAYFRTYGFPAMVVRPSNNYGPWQYPEKLLPLSVSRVMRGERIPVYGTGKNVREWLYVEDCAKGILRVLEKGAAGETYNLGSGEERKNIEVISSLLRAMGAGKDMIEFVADRPGHDIRYSLDSSKIRKSLGWRPETGFEEGLKETVSWCMAHKAWLLEKEAL